MQLYHLIRNAIEPQALRIIKEATLIMKDVQYFLMNVSPEDKNFFAEKSGLVQQNCWAMYATPQSEALMLELLPKIQETFAVTVHPTYSFTRIYWPDSELPPHRDRPQCEYSATACIDIDPEPWGIWFEDHELVLYPGDVVLYKGRDVTHWRRPYHGRQQIQIFTHYVDKNGSHAHEALDKRPILGLHYKKERE